MIPTYRTSVYAHLTDYDWRRDESRVRQFASIALAFRLSVAAVAAYFAVLLLFG